MADATSDNGAIGVMPRLMTNKVETCLWLTRLLTVFFGILFILPFVGGEPQGIEVFTTLCSHDWCHPFLNFQVNKY